MKLLTLYHKRAFIIITCLVLVIFTGNVLCAAFNKHVNHLFNNTPVYTEYAGSAACMACHHAICDSQFITAHALTSRPAARQYIKGSFEEGNNHFIYNHL